MYTTTGQPNTATLINTYVHNTSTYILLFVVLFQVSSDTAVLAPFTRRETIIHDTHINAEGVLG